MAWLRPTADECQRLAKAEKNDLGNDDVAQIVRGNVNRMAKIAFWRDTAMDDSFTVPGKAMLPSDIPPFLRGHRLMPRFWNRINRMNTMRATTTRKKNGDI